MNIRIAQIADIQISAGGNYANRTSQYRTALSNLSKQVIADKPDAIVICGDQFERYVTTDNERLLYIQFIQSLLTGLPKSHIIIIDGNHDIRKRNFVFFDGSSETTHVHVNEEIFESLNNPRYHYSAKARMLRIAEIPDMVFACWSELARFDDAYGNPSPYEGIEIEKIEELKKSSILVDVYHGTAANAKIPGLSIEIAPDPDTRLGHFCMAGHIHKYQVLGNLVYSSSVVERDFSEGTRIIVGIEDNPEFEVIDGMLTTYDYVNEHGYVLWDIDTASRKVSHEFKPVYQPITYLTLELTRLATQEQVAKLLSSYTREVNLKLVLDNVDSSVLSYLYNFVQNHRNLKIIKVESVKKEQQITQHETQIHRQIDLDVDNVVELSAELIGKDIKESFLATDEMKQRALDYFKSVLKQELSFHLHSENLHNVIFKSLDVSNFRSIYRAHVDFDEHGLLAVRGQNGNGKTTIFEAMNFLCTGQHNETFKGNAKKQYYMRLFNDKVFDDNFVKLIGNAVIDGKELSIRVTLERRLQPDATIDDWKSKVTQILRTIEIFDGDECILQGPEADTWLHEIFGDYEDFCILHNITQFTLDSIKYMPNDKLAKFILHRLGYSFLGKLSYYLAGCRNAENEKWPKPTMQSVTEMNTGITNLKDSITESEKYIDRLESENSDKAKDCTTIQSQIDEKTATLTKIPTDLIDGWRKQTASHTKESLVTAVSENSHQIQVLEDEHKSAQVKYDKYIKAKERYDKAATAYANKCKELLEQITANYDRQRAEANEQLSSKQDERDNIIKKNSEIAQTRTSLESAIQMAQKTIEFKTAEKTQAEHAVEDLTNNKCSFCGSSLVGRNVDITKQLEFEKNRVSRLQSEINEQSAIIEKSRKELSNLGTETDVTELDNDIQRIRGTLNDIDKGLCKIATADYQVQIMEANAAEIYQEYVDAKSALASEDANVNISSILSRLTELKDNERILSEIKKAFEYLDSYESTIQKNAEIQEVIDSLKSQLSEAQRTIESNNYQIRNSQNDIDTSNTKIEALKESIDRMIEWEIRQVGFKAYEKLVNEVLPKYLYLNACGIINNYIDSHELPTKIQPFLSELNYGAILLRDRTSEGGNVYRNIQDASGMELTICGLLICLAMHEANQYTNFRFVMLDEITGKLSTGTETDPTNYLEVFRKIVSKASQHTMISVIDHRLEDSAFDNVINVIKRESDNLSITDNYDSLCTGTDQN